MDSYQSSRGSNFILKYLNFTQSNLSSLVTKAFSQFSNKEELCGCLRWLDSKCVFDIVFVCLFADLRRAHQAGDVLSGPVGERHPGAKSGPWLWPQPQHWLTAPDYPAAWLLPGKRWPCWALSEENLERAFPTTTIQTTPLEIFNILSFFQLPLLSRLAIFSQMEQFFVLNNPKLCVFGLCRGAWVPATLQRVGWVGRGNELLSR